MGPLRIKNKGKASALPPQARTDRRTLGRWPGPWASSQGTQHQPLPSSAGSLRTGRADREDSTGQWAGAGVGNCEGVTRTLPSCREPSEMGRSQSEGRCVSSVSWGSRKGWWPR